MTAFIKHGLFLFLGAVFSFLFLAQEVRADYIALDTLQSTSIDGEWTMGDPIAISALSPNMGPGPNFYAIDPLACFTLATGPGTARSLRGREYYTYSGSFTVANGEETFIRAEFENLFAYCTMDNEYLKFRVAEFSSLGGSLVKNESLKLTLTSSIQLANLDIFHGMIYGDGLEKPDPLLNPEPATFFLFGIGLMGIAGVGRKTYPD